MADQDYYEILGVSRDASAAEIKAAFRTLARRYHPDVYKESDAQERFKEVNLAYLVLSDPAQRSRYDRFGPAEFGDETLMGESGGNLSGGLIGAFLRLYKKLSKDSTSAASSKLQK